MISPETRAQIRRYFYAEHWKIGTIARQLDLHPDTVRNAIETGRVAAQSVRPSKLDPYLGFLREVLSQHPTLRATRIYQMARERGYTGSVVQLRRAVARLRPQIREPFLRLETFPGEQGQVDWAHFGHVQVGRARRALSCFVMTLSYSRALYLEFFFDQTTENFLRGHVHAFEAWGGAPRVVLPDFVPGHKIIVLWRIALCGHWRGSPRWSGWPAWIRQHNLQSESSHFSRSGSLLHPAAGRHSGEESTGGRHAATAACFVRNVISA